MKIDDQAFFAACRREIGALNQRQVDALSLLLQFMRDDPTLDDERHAAYMLATVRQECGDGYAPVAEGFYLRNPGAFRRKLRYYPWYGRGYVQLTWRANYARAERELGVAFTRDPDLALVSEHAYAIMSRGMREGWFTGLALRDYIAGELCDYRNARRIINGTDRARRVAGFARQFERIINAARQA